jgi:hypothetical protein
MEAELDTYSFEGTILHHLETWKIAIPQPKLSHGSLKI